MENEGALAVVVPQEFGLSMTRDPNAILAEGHRAAKALKDLIASKPADEKVMMNGKQYLEFEDWSTVATFYKTSAKVVSTEYIEIGSARGFLAKADAINVLTGQVVSSAEAMCLNDEDKWSTRSKYEWKNGKKEKVGDVAVPMFQLRSMAQTRACSKALRNVFSWVVVLAGYAPTPAEDMTGEENPNGEAKPPIPAPQEKPAEPPKQDGEPKISDKQGKRLYAIWKGADKPDQQVMDYLKTKYGISTTKDIKATDYDAICAWAEANEPA